jgi:membrane fusion protein, multidrug efflux system
MAQMIEPELEELEQQLQQETNVDSPEGQPNSSLPRGKRRRWVLLSVATVAVIATTVWWLIARNYESTDDAQVDGHLDLVSARIAGTVTYINPKIENNQFVEAGTLLLELDPRDYEAELQHARANLDTRTAEARSASVNVPIVVAASFGGLHSAEAAREQALAGVNAERANLAAAEHKLQQDEAIYARAERDRIRYHSLVEAEVISVSEYDGRETEAKAAAQAVESDRAAILALEHRIAEARNLVVQREAQVEAARNAPQQVSDARARSASAAGQLEQSRADLHTAELNLGYTRIYAPVSGIIGRKTVELGHRVQPGQSLLAIVPVDDIWITANFKETQLKHMRPGQAVSVRVDTFGREYKGRVESLPGAAGPVFSLFPPENATGNYVKVVQRFPVRIRLEKGQDAEHVLRPGMSVEPSVDVR